MRRGMNGVIRRSQLIAPFGVGSMTVLANGTSVIGAGLDHWFSKPEHSAIDLSEYEVREWRLQQRLRVGGFRLPPDYRTHSSSGAQPFNVGLTVPFLRFPTWSFCPQTTCKRLKQHPLSLQERPACDSPKHEGAKYDSLMVQVSFVAICENGHIMDFPWSEWVHRNVAPSCRGELKLMSTGGGTLDGQRVECSCGVRPRTLRDVTIAGPDGSRLTSSLEKGHEFLCPGARPWHGSNSFQPCGAPVRASLRGASNVYFAQVASSIFLPERSEEVQHAVDVLSDAKLNSQISALADVGYPVTPEIVRKFAGAQVSQMSDESLQAALEAVLTAMSKAHQEDPSEADVSEQDFRRPEYRLLRDASTNDSLRITPVERDVYGDNLGYWFNRVTLVDRLRETRALWGFSRVHPDPPTKEIGKAMLRAASVDFTEQWLPAYVVHGEGIYLEFDEDRLAEWESRRSVADRITRLRQRNQAAARRDTRTGPLTARLVMLHTFAHVLINQLVFECGYSSAALRERLFVSQPPDAMAGVLVYTASGDSEGTMGGLVRMGKPGRLEPVLRAARDKAAWCASDPVCMDVGDSGQGPESCNLAACHNCTLLPETACEEFNRFLDRAMLVGTVDDPTVGIFASES
jgi:hypothetical protein